MTIKCETYQTLTQTKVQGRKSRSLLHRGPFIPISGVGNIFHEIKHLDDQDVDINSNNPCSGSMGLGR